MWCECLNLKKVIRFKITRSRVESSNPGTPTLHRHQDWDPPFNMVTVPGPLLPYETSESGVLSPVSTLNPESWLSRETVEPWVPYSMVCLSVLTLKPGTLPPYTVIGSEKLRSPSSSFLGLPFYDDTETGSSTHPHITTKMTDL